MSNDARAKVTEFDDGKHVRTAIVIPFDGVSFDLVDLEGNRIGEINVFAYGEDHVNKIIIDVIDKDEIFSKRRALVFNEGVRDSIDAGHIVCADFEK